MIEIETQDSSKEGLKPSLLDRLAETKGIEPRFIPFDLLCESIAVDSLNEEMSVKIKLWVYASWYRNPQYGKIGEFLPEGAGPDYEKIRATTLDDIRNKVMFDDDLSKKFNSVLNRSELLRKILDGSRDTRRLLIVRDMVNEQIQLGLSITNIVKKVQVESSAQFKLLYAEEDKAMETELDKAILELVRAEKYTHVEIIEILSLRFRREFSLRDLSNKIRNFKRKDLLEKRYFSSRKANESDLSIS